MTVNNSQRGVEPMNQSQQPQQHDSITIPLELLANMPILRRHRFDVVVECGDGVWCVGWWWCVICVMVDGGDIDLGEEMRIGSWCGASVTFRPSLKTQIFYNFDNKSIVFISLWSRTPSKTPCTLIWSDKIIFGYASSPTPFVALLV